MLRYYAVVFAFMFLTCAVKLKSNSFFQALKYEEDYDTALASFKRAQELDPTWDAPKCLERTLTKFLLDVKVGAFWIKYQIEFSPFSLCSN